MKNTFCLIFIVACHSAAGQTTCYHLPKSSSAYYSCESLRQQEQLIQNQKRDSETRNRQVIEEANRNATFQSYQYQQNDRQRASDEKAAFFLSGERAEKALNKGNCEEAQNKLDEAEIVPFVSSANAFPKAAANDAVVELQLKIIDKCISGSKKDSAKIEFLNKMKSRPGKLAQDELNKIAFERKKSSAIKKASSEKSIDLSQIALELISTEDNNAHIQWTDDKKDVGYIKVALKNGTGKTVDKLHQLIKGYQSNNVIEYYIYSASSPEHYLDWKDFKSSLDRAAIATELLCKIEKFGEYSYFKVNMPSKKNMVIHESIGLAGSSGMGSEPDYSIIISDNSLTCASKMADPGQCCLP